MDITPTLPATASATGAGIMPGGPQRPPAASGLATAAPRQNSGGTPAAPELQPEEVVQEARKGTSPEEQAIRAAFQAQLNTAELLSVVRDPADLMLPQQPEIVS